MSTIYGGTLKGMIIDSKFSALPADFASLRLDLDFLNVPSITFNGSNISQINDLSGQSRNFSQATAGSQPSWTSGLGATFNGDFLECLSNLITDSDGTFIGIVRFDRANGTEYMFGQGDSGTGDGDGFDFIKNPSGSGNNVRSVFRVGNAPGIGSMTAFTDTTTFRVFTFQKDNIYVNSVQENLMLYGSAPLTRWFNNPTSPTRMVIGKIPGSLVASAMITVKRMSYFNARLTNADVIRLVNGLRLYYNI